LKRLASIFPLILPLLALVSAQSLSAQTLVVDKPTLTFSGQVGGAAVTQTVNVTSSTGASIPFALIVPQAYSWLKVGEQSIISGNTPAAITITADPTGLTAGTYPATPPALISVSGGSTNTNIAVTFNVSTIGVAPQTLAFSYTFGTNNYPAPQNVSLSSTTGIQCTVTAANPTGGNWIGPLQSTCVSPGNVTVQLNNSVVNGLSPNTYTGTVTITPSAGLGPPAVVVVTLTVLPTPPVTVNPASLILNYQTGIGAPNPSQTFTITTTAGQQLGFSFTQQSGSLSNISTIAPPSGATNPANGIAQVAYTVNPTGLAVGTYTGKITLFTFGGSPPQQDIAITLNVSATALLNVPSATLNFTGQLGNTPAAQTVSITATSGLLNYSVYTSNFNPSGLPSWLVVQNAGSTAAPLQVSVNPTGLAAGTYSATINVVSATVGSVAQQIPVVLKVSNDPAISASVSTMSFPYQIGQLAPATQSFRITSSTGVPLNYVTTVSTTTCGSAWLQAVNANNSQAGVTDDTLTVSVATAGLAPGICSGTLTINATNPATGGAAVSSPINIGVTLFVSSNAQLVLTPANLQPFNVGVGAQSPASQQITLTSTSTDVLSYQVSFQSPGNWLSVNTLSGTTAAPNNILNISAFTGGLAANVYNGSVTVTASGPGGAVADSPVTIPVTLNVSAGTLTVSKTDLTFPSQNPGGAAPIPQTVTIGSSGQPLNYNAVANSNNPVTWLSVSPTSGNTTASGIITVAVDGSKLAAGPYNGTIVVSSPGAGNVTINVHFTVNPGTLSAPNTTLTFTQAFGGAAPPAQTVAVTASPVALTFTTASTTTNGVSWLSATPATGTTPSNVQVSVSGGGLAQGQYTGTVTIASAGAAGSPIAVGVILNVVPAAVLAVSPTDLSFAYNIGQTLPAPQNLAVTATNSVPITAQVQQDGTAGSWLTVTPASGTAPATLAVSVGSGATSLAAGKYTAHIVISSPNSLVSVSVAVTLTVTTIPQPVVNSVANAANYSTGAVSPGENIVIFGSGVGPATLVNGLVVNNAFTTVAGSTRVLFDNTAAPIIYASSGQTSVMVPYGVAGRTTTSIVVEYFGVQSAPLTYSVAPAAPGIYTLNQQGTGPGAILNQDGLTVNGVNNPEKRGNVIAIYMTGEGQTTPQGADGVIIPAVASALKKPNLPVTVTVGGIDAPVQYAGSAPSLVSGVMQVNVTIPLTVPVGTQPVVVTVGTAKSQSGASAATVAIQ
jgi:uncharacterized protein (TIGR03437 family)